MSDGWQLKNSHKASNTDNGICFDLPVQISEIVACLTPVFSDNSTWDTLYSAINTFNLDIINSIPLYIKGCWLIDFAPFICYYLLLLFDSVNFSEIHARNI